jgi:hypothetical protein
VAALVRRKARHLQNDLQPVNTPWHEISISLQLPEEYPGLPAIAPHFNRVFPGK